MAEKDQRSGATPEVSLCTGTTYIHVVCTPNLAYMNSGLPPMKLVYLSAIATLGPVRWKFIIPLWSRKRCPDSLQTSLCTKQHAACFVFPLALEPAPWHEHQCPGRYLRGWTWICRVPLLAAYLPPHSSLFFLLASVSEEQNWPTRWSVISVTIQRVGEGKPCWGTALLNYGFLRCQRIFPAEK